MRNTLSHYEAPITLYEYAHNMFALSTDVLCSKSSTINIINEKKKKLAIMCKLCPHGHMSVVNVGSAHL